MMPMQISVILPSYNPDLRRLTDCLEAVHASSYKPFEVILVDDGSAINYPERIKSYCRLIKNKKNIGPAYARNIGAREARGDILCFIDTDVKIMQSTLAKIAEKFYNTDIAAVQTLYSEFSPSGNFFSQYQNLYQHYSFTSIGQKYLNTLSSYCIAIRRDVFHEAGGFDENIKNASIEDELLAVALYSRGYKILLAKDIEIENIGYFNIKKLLKRMFIMGRDKSEYFGKYPKTRKMDLSRTHHPLNRIASVLISPLILLFLATAVLPLAKILIVLIMLLFLLLNRGFFSFIYKKKGIWFMFKSIIIFYFVCLAVFLGCIKGAINYLTNR